MTTAVNSIQVASKKAGPVDFEQIRRDFPILAQTVNGKPLVYLDNAATSQKPRSVLDAIDRYYLEDNANVHRGIHSLSERATRHYEEARVAVKRLLNAADAHEIIFTRGATEGINLVASSLGASFKPGDEILLTYMEHHSNIVPWQMLCERTGAVLKVAPIDDTGTLMLDEFARLLSPRTRMVAVVHISNALGSINPVAEITRLAHDAGAYVLIDGAQAVPHQTVDVTALDCDFYVFSGHKVYAPTGFGVLYGKQALLDAMPPYQGGGDMISTVTFEKTTYNELPYKFEAGTPHIEGAIGLAAAIEYVDAIGYDAIEAYEHELLDYGTARLMDMPGLRLIGTASEKAGILSFVLDYAHPHDIGTILDQQGIAIRTGHHCVQPVMQRFGIPATARASLAFYNNHADIDALVQGIETVHKLFS